MKPKPGTLGQEILVLQEISSAVVHKRNVDALLNEILAQDVPGIVFDLRDNEPMYISFSDMELHNYVYPWSFNDMTMYDREALVSLNSLQRALTEWYMDFDKLPLIGLAASMSFHVLLMLALLYLSIKDGRRECWLSWLPALATL